MGVLSSLCQKFIETVSKDFRKNFIEFANTRSEELEFEKVRWSHREMSSTRGWEEIFADEFSDLESSSSSSDDDLDSEIDSQAFSWQRGAGFIPGVFTFQGSPGFSSNFSALGEDVLRYFQVFFDRRVMNIICQRRTIIKDRILGEQAATCETGKM